MTIKMHASSSLYIHEVIQLGWLQLSPLVRPKRYELCALLIPKLKLQYTNHKHCQFLRSSWNTQTICVISPKGVARTLKQCASWRGCLHTLYTFLTLFKISLKNWTIVPFFSGGVNFLLRCSYWDQQGG